MKILVRHIAYVFTILISHTIFIQSKTFSVKLLGIPESNADVNAIAASMQKSRLYTKHSGSDAVAQNAINPFLSVCKMEPNHDC